MPKNFTKKVFLLIAVNLLVKPIWIFGVERNVQINAGFEVYGLYFTLLNFTYLLGIINDMGLSTYNIKLVTQAVNQSENLSINLGIKLALSSVYAVLIIILGYFLGYWSPAFFLLLTLMIYQISVSFLGYLRSFLTGLQYFKADVLISVLDKFLLLIFFLPLMSFHFFDPYFSIQIFASAQLIAILLSIVVCLIILKGKVYYSFKTFELSKLFGFIKQLLPFSIFMFLVLAYNKIDSIMLEKMLDNGALESGIYAAAYRLLDALSMIPILFASFFYPIISMLLVTQRDIKKLILSASEFLISLAIVMATTLWFFKSELMGLLYQEKSSIYLSEVFGLLVWNIIPITIYYIFSTALTAKGNLKALNLVALLSLLLNVLLNLFLIPEYKALGAALSTIISLSAAGIAYVYFYARSFKHQFNFLLLGKFILLGTFIWVFAYSFHYLTMHWMLKFLLFFAIGVSLTFTLKLISIKKIISLAKFTA